MRRYLPFLALTTFTTLLVACSPAGSGDDAITIDDVFDTRDLLTADADTSGALMWAGARLGVVLARSLTKDDVEGVCAIYPVGTTRPGPGRAPATLP